MSDTLPRTGEPPARRRSADLALPAAPAEHPATGPIIERAGADVYVVLEGVRPAGFIDVVGTVFVALRGCHYDRAVEVGQTRELGSAAALIVAAHDGVDDLSGRTM